MAFDGRVDAASAEWIYIPDDARRVVTGEFVVIEYPETWTLPTQVRAIDSDRPAAELIAEVAEIVRGWERGHAAWWVNATTRPPDLEQVLQAAGAILVETVTVLALDLADGLPDVGDTGDVIARVVSNAADAHAYSVVASAVWHASIVDDETVHRWLRESADGSGVRVVAYMGGEPASCGGLTIAGDVARLWGGATAAPARGRGAYRATLYKRLSLARERGATLALVKGRIDTSAPILHRVGFTSHGNERAYRLPIHP